jgi:hypothetical protein
LRVLAEWGGEMKVTLSEASFDFIQDADCCQESDDNQILEVAVCDGGGGKYFRIKTQGFAVESGADLEALFDKIRKLFGEAWDT